MGRSGSTVVYNSVVAGMSAMRFGSRTKHLDGLVRDVAWRLEGTNLKHGRVYKTHDFPQGIREGANPRVIFLFGSASTAVRSVIHCKTKYGRDWVDEHFNHLSASGPYEEIQTRDVLRFDEQLERWLSFESVPVLALRYENLWSEQLRSTLQQYVGFPVQLPPWRQRETQSGRLGSVENLITKTYADLDSRIAALPPIIANQKAQEMIKSCAATE